MNVCYRAVSSAALFLAALGGLSQYRPAWAEGTGLDWWNLPQMHETIRRNQKGLDDMQPRCERLVARCTAKGEVIDDLRDGRLTLPRAAARFRDLSRAADDVPDVVKVVCPGASEGERRCRQVINWAAAEADTASPGTGAATRARLEAELQRLLDENGGVIVLPE